MSREPKCEGCGKVITLILSDVGSASGYLCLDCSGATIEDFLDDDMTAEDYLENEVELRRTFHGRD